jgi:hypothetical protein
MMLASRYETSCRVCKRRFKQCCNSNLTLIVNIFGCVFQHKYMPPTGHRLEFCLYSILLLSNRCYFFFLSTTNKVRCYTIFFIIVTALHVPGGFSAHHQELKNCTHSIWCMSSLLAATTSSSSKQEKLPRTCRAVTITKNIV